MTRTASVTVSYNDWNQINNWKKYYNEYKDVLDYHIIVDNNSDIKYREFLKKTFPDSLIIERNKNGGVTAAFNDGIKFCMNSNNIDYIMLICPDIYIDGNSVLNIVNKLHKEIDLGVVAPLLLDNNGKVELYGGNISRYFSPLYYYKGYNKSFNLLPNEIDSPFIPGGICVSKTSTYEKVGLQDENLFMYSDEVDWMIRVRNEGIRSIFIKDSKASHNHINNENDIYRSDLAYFLINRNIILVAWKHSGFLSVLNTSIYIFKIKYYQILGMIKRKRFKKAIASCLGILYGVFNYYSIPKHLLKNN
jgi:GT2 family glycosyltransferase